MSIIQSIYISIFIGAAIFMAIKGEADLFIIAISGEAFLLNNDWNPRDCADSSLIHI